MADVIVKMHNGEIKVKSKPAEGTTFEIVLPRKYIHHKHGTQQSNEESNNEKPVRDLRGALPLINIIRYAINQDPALCKNPAT